MTEEEKKELIEELHNDPEVMEQIKRSIEAYHRGDVVHWNDLKTELGLNNKI